MGTRFEQAMLAAAAVFPALTAVLHAENVADAAHDGGVIRTVVLGWAGPWQALDAWIAAPFLVLPIGTQVFRAALASAVVCGVAGAVMYGIARALLSACAPTRWLGPAVAAIAAATAALSMAWQTEGMAPGGATLGALLVLLAVAAAGTKRTAPAGFFALAALVYEPWAGAAAVAGALLAGGTAFLQGHRPARPDRRELAVLAAALAPLVLLVLRRPRTAFFATVPWFPMDASPAHPVFVAHEQLGWLALVLAGAGLAASLLASGARPLATGLVGVVAVSAGAIACGGTAVGPTHFGAVTLAGVAGLALLSAAAMHELVRVVHRAQVPLASASAAMIVLLELAFPVVLFDDTSMRAEERTRAARVAWHEALFGGLPARTVLLANDGRFLEHLSALRAAHLLRGDLAVVSTAHLNARPAVRELAREPKLAAFFRDMALNGLPSEWGFTTLASERPLAVLFEPTWDRSIARHLIAIGAIDLFHPEPRSTLERKRALEAFSPVRARWEQLLGAPENPDVRALVAIPLQARAEALAATRERELASRTEEDLRGVTPTRNSGGVPIR
ncbi:hypothetical protein LVJ94_46720 [Pendulispora rubella]|uniref:Glycosyltransferase RgtA/B/C/D-like domain-containing protein n=1 Tax=Pendulispora rubella TaxID=2741070 RepID=A0ABZ2L0P4_9BACT